MATFGAATGEVHTSLSCCLAYSVHHGDVAFAELAKLKKGEKATRFFCSEIWFR